MADRMIIAVDGPAASGKGTIARALARHYHLPHLDTGLLYRAVAQSVLDHELDPEIEADAVASCGFDDLLLADDRLKDEGVGRVASIVSAHPLVRAALLQRQRRFAAQPGGAVLDGRDIGTVIAPDAEVKLLVKVTPAIRAKRRHRELRGRGAASQFADVLADIRTRDDRDANRAAAPLLKAWDAVLLDTTHLGIEEAFEAAMDVVRGRLSRR